MSLNTIPEQRTSLQYAAFGAAKLVIEGRITLKAAIARITGQVTPAQSPTRQLYARLAAEYDARPQEPRVSTGLTGEVNSI